MKGDTVEVMEKRVIGNQPTRLLSTRETLTTLKVTYMTLYITDLDQYTTTTREIAHHVGKEYKNGGRCKEID